MPLARCIVSVALILCFAVTTARGAPVVGGWDVSRGGPYSLSAGSNTAGLRSLLGGLIPGTTFTGAATLTPAYLSTVNTVVLSVAFDDNTPITPLSGAEQTALMNFVLGGGRALLLGERTSLAAAANPTLINPFGLNITGGVIAHLPATVPQPFSTEITREPFGVVTTLATINPGWFDQLGLAKPVATLDANGKPLLAVLGSGALGPGSGRVVLSADSDIYTQNLVLIENTFAYLVPEPSTIWLAFGGGSFLVFGVWRGASRRARK
jgi:hypothetical protein